MSKKALYIGAGILLPIHGKEKRYRDYFKDKDLYKVKGNFIY